MLAVLVLTFAFLVVLTWVGIINAEQQSNSAWGLMALVSHALSYAILVMLLKSL